MVVAILNGAADEENSRIFEGQVRADETVRTRGEAIGRLKHMLRIYLEFVGARGDIRVDFDKSDQKETKYDVPALYWRSRMYFAL